MKWATFIATPAGFAATILFVALEHKHAFVLPFVIGPPQSSLCRRFVVVRHIPSRPVVGLWPTRGSSSTCTSIGSTSADNLATKQSCPNPMLPKKLVDALDLEPLIEGVAQHCATKRGRDALLALVDTDGNRSTRSAGSSGPSRRTALAAVTSYSPKAPGDARHLSKERPPEPIAIVGIAQSAAEARDEFDLIRQATTALRADKSRYGKEEISGSPDLLHGGDGSNCDDAVELTIPPIYGTSSPWDIGTADTDDDEWLPLALSGYGASMELENILEADQIVKRLLETRAWADLNSTKEIGPGLAQIGNRINARQLQALHDEIEKTVDIVRTRTISDPSGTKSFSFRLNGAKFPALGLLRRRERDIMDQMDDAMQQLLRSKSFAGKLANNGGGRRRSDAFDLHGRLVVSAPRNVASSIGVIRGFSKKGSTCYVEPTSIIDKGDDLSEIREEIAGVENQITQHLISAIVHAAPFIESGLDSVARIDTIFARAAFGCTLNGVIPEVENEGRIEVRDFIHPVLALKDAGDRKSEKVVPIDLLLSGNAGQRSLIISGPNGGGKTLALKSFGVSAVMSRLSIPLPVGILPRRHQNERPARVDFFGEVLVEVGDQQSVAGGESTLMARLNACSEVIQRVSVGIDALERDDGPGVHCLILLDELGGGTDPEAGSAIARAILEKLLESSNARIIATTHSPQLKALSIDDERFCCASVLLDSTPDVSNRFKRPTFQLSYGTIGDSYALGAASRCTPALPADVLDRAADLMAGGEGGSGDVLRAISTSLEREKEAARMAAGEAKILIDDTIRCRNAVVSLAKAYADHLSRLENRLDSIFSDLKEDESRNAYDLVGETLREVRHVKKRVLSQKELLAQRGLKMVPDLYEFKDGESVVIVAPGEWDGQTATVTCKHESDTDLEGDKVAVVPSLDWGGWDFDSEGEEAEAETEATAVRPITLSRNEIALWDYPSDVGGEWDSKPTAKSVSDARQSLFDTLSKVTPSERLGSSSTAAALKSSTSSKKAFTSSRERKAATAASKKEKKRAKKKSKKRN